MNESRKEFAKEISKLFTLEELSWLMYENECLFCSMNNDRNRSCFGDCSVETCAKNIHEYYKTIQGVTNEVY